MSYVFAPGDRVRRVNSFMAGIIELCVPGNGSIEWYYVMWDDGSQDRYTRDELEKI